MRLADAIREGSKRTAQAQHTYIICDAFDRPFKACALGAAALAVSISPREIGVDALIEQWPELDYSIGGYTCPMCGQTNDLYCTIAHLNDFHQRSREAIADWLDSISIEQSKADTWDALTSTYIPAEGGQ